MIQVHYVYILKNNRGMFYVGQTNNIHRRLEDHSNMNGAKLIKDYNGFELAYTEEFKTRAEAMRREKQLKGWSNAKKAALISGDFEALRTLSKNRQD